MLLLAVGLFAGALALAVWVPALMIYWPYPWPLYAMLLASVGSALMSHRRGALRTVTVGGTAMLSIGFLAVTLLVPRLDRGQLAVHPGDAFPDFKLQTSTGEWFSPSQLKGQRPALYVFYRGDW